MPRVNRTKYAILGMLSFEPMSGYDMKKRFDNSIAHFWNENYGHLYPVLKRLEKEGLVTRQVESTGGKPDRHVYSITDDGGTDLQEWLRLPAERPTLRIELLLKLIFGHFAPLDSMVQNIEAEKVFCERTLDNFQRIEEHIKSVDTKRNGKDAPFSLIALRYGQHYYRAVHEWCEETLQTLEDSRGGQE